MIGCEYLVAGTQGERAGNDVEGKGGIGDVNDVIPAGIDVVAQRLPCVGKVFRQVVDNELHRLALQAALPCLVGVEYRPGRGPKRPVIEKHDIGIEEKLVTQGHKSLRFSVPALVDLGQNERCQEQQDKDDGDDNG